VRENQLLTYRILGSFFVALVLQIFGKYEFENMHGKREMKENKSVIFLMKTI
jgi:hypothetical protein